MSAAKFLGVSGEPRLVPPYTAGAFLIAYQTLNVGRRPTGLSAESIIAYCKVWNDWVLSPNNRSL